MAIKKYIVRKELYIRTSPWVFENNTVGTLQPGFIFDAVSEVFGGFYRKTNINVWLKDANGFYYWKGGVEALSGDAEQDLELPQIPYAGEPFQTYLDNCFVKGQLKSKIDYLALLRLSIAPPHPDAVAPVMIGILDQPISTVFSTTQNILKSTTESMSLKTDHGTLVAGLIAGTGNIQGVGRDFQLIELPIRDGTGQWREDLLNQSIKYITEITREKPQLRLIINVSQFFDPKYTALLSTLTHNPSVILVAAAGIDDALTKGLSTPASLDRVITVGTVTEQYRKSNPNAPFNKALSVIFPEFSYLSYTRERRAFGLIKQDSAATAITSGIVAQLARNAQTAFNFDEIKRQLLKQSKRYKDIQSFQTLNPINPFT